MSLKACIGLSNNFFDVCTLPDMLSIAVDAGMFALAAPILISGIQALYKDCSRMHQRELLQERDLQRSHGLRLLNNQPTAVNANANEQPNTSLTSWLGLS
ncbi:MAG: hypothetical protein P1U63_13235 [Coxiellaceae bacterium]|nr:hypothetical protein [Coxiellaceae bacterium]